jgi:hypothetical protein
MSSSARKKSAGPHDQVALKLAVGETALDHSVQAPAPSNDDMIPETPMSSRLWQIDWSRHFPFALSDTVDCHYVGFHGAIGFIKANFGTIYHLDDRENRFYNEPLSDAKVRYYEASGDFFIFRDKTTGREVGVALGTPIDWAGYNFRNVAIVPEYQSQGLYQIFFPYLAKILAEHGVERLEGDVAPSNLPHIHALNKMGAVVTGLNMSDRWGGQLHFIKYLSKPAKAVFLNQFCWGIEGDE